MKPNCFIIPVCVLVTRAIVGASTEFRDNLWTPATAVTEEWAKGGKHWQISPDCRSVLWIRTTPDPKSDGWSDALCLSSLVGRSAVQLTGGAETISEARWSPDGQLVAFISPRPTTTGGGSGVSRIWTTASSDRATSLITPVNLTVYHFEWDGVHSIIFSAEDPEHRSYELKNDQRDNVIIVDDSRPDIPVQLFRIDLRSKEILRLTSNRDRIQEFCLAPDHKHAAAIHRVNSRSDYDKSSKPTVQVWDLSSGAVTRLFQSLHHPVEHLQWDQTGKYLYGVSTKTSDDRRDYPGILEIVRCNLSNAFVEHLRASGESGLAGEDFQVTKDGLMTFVADGINPRLTTLINKDGHWTAHAIHPPHGFSCREVVVGSDEKTIVFRDAPPDRPSQWYRGDLDHGEITAVQQITDLNRQFADIPTAKREIVHWKGAKGEQVEGLLYYPISFDASKKYPLLVDLHGGPAWAYQDQWYGPVMNCNVFASRGMFVFRPNYHGSSQYGLRFVESVIGRYGEYEVRDVETAVDMLIRRGVADSERLALIGWSNGGTLVASITGRNKRYRAAIAGCAVIDWSDYWGTSDVGDWVCKSYFGSTALSAPTELVKRSSFYNLCSVPTPTLIIGGVNDRRAPVGQSWKYYRALQQTGRAPVRLMLLENDGHGPSTLSHAKRVLEEEVDWLDKYLIQP